ncbi:MAG: serine/threonine-protein kinase [Myxococcota bacterium]
MEFAVGTLADDERQRVEHHVDECDHCMTLLADVAQLAAPTRPTPTHLHRGGDRLGRYVLLREVGRGGMGMVFAAYDPELDRQVALKILRDPAGDHRDPCAAHDRLAREAKTMAKLSHPHIVPVFDVGQAPLPGETEPVLFVAMELVEGQTLRTWRSPTRRWDEYVRLFVQCGRGLAAAHDAGIVHRDFKPDNVLVDAQGRARVTDFGLARRLEHSDERPPLATGPSNRSGPDGATVHTEHGQLVGTPAYMAPEQFSTEPATPAVDQFAFCVSMYEALYGVRPFEGQTFELLREAIQHDLPREPPTTGGPSPPWLRRVVMRGLAKRPEDRHPSMDALVTTLERGLERQARYRRLAAGVGLLTLLTAGAYTAGVQRSEPTPCPQDPTWLADVWDPSVRARVLDALTAVERPYAPAVGAYVADTLDAWANGWIDARLDACQATRVRAEQSPTMMDRRIRCLERRRHEVRALVQTLTDADQDMLDRAATMLSAVVSPRICADVEMLSAMVPPPEDPRIRARVEHLHERLDAAAAAESAGRHASGLRITDEIAPEVDSLDHAPLRAAWAYRRGRLLADAGDYEHAERQLAEAIQAAVAGGDLRALAEAAGVHGFVLGLQQGEHQRGLDAVAMGRAAAGRLTDVALSARLLSYEGQILGSTGDLSLARQTLERAEQILLDHDEATAHDLATVSANLGNILAKLGHYALAETRYRRTMEVDRATYGLEHPAVARIMGNLANVLAALGRFDESVQMAEQALQIRETHLGPEHPEVAETLNNLGVIHTYRGRHDLALPPLQRALEIRQRALGSEHPVVAATLNNIGLSQVETDRFAEAETTLERAHALGLAALGPEHTNVLMTEYNLGRAAAGRGDHALAVERLAHVLEGRVRVLGPEHPHVGSCADALASSLWALGRHEHARAHWARAAQVLAAAERWDDYADSRLALAEAMGSEGPSIAREALAQLQQAGITDAQAPIRRWLSEYDPP